MVFRSLSREDGRVSTQREQLVAELVRATSLLSRQLVRYYHAVADQLGLPLTDLTCVSLLRDRRRAHAGELASELGLTTGAVTRVIDRLHRAGLVRRLPDPSDGRRVIVELIPEAEASVAGLFAGHAAHITETAADLSDDDLALLVRYTQSRAEVSRSEADRLRREGKAHATRRSTSAS